MHTAGRTPDVAYVVAPATATEHGQPGGNIVVCGLAALPGHRVVSIGSVNVRYDASNDTATRVIELVQHEMHLRLHSCISTCEIRDCSCSATEQTDTSAYRSQTIGIAADYYNNRSWSGTIEAISRCVAAYERAANAYEISNCEDIMSKLLRYVQSLLQKCVSNVYLRQHVTSIITDYIWNRCCNVASRMLLDDIVTSGKRSTTSSQQDLNYTVDLLEHCADYLKTYSDEILTELLYYRSATEQAVRHRHS